MRSMNTAMATPLTTSSSHIIGPPLPSKVRIIEYCPAGSGDAAARNIASIMGLLYGGVWAVQSAKHRGFQLASPGRVPILSRMEKPDQLRELFRMQKALNARIGVHTEGMSDEEKTKWILNYCRAMSQEMAELTDSVPWKWWAKYQKFDEQNARVEVVDLFHFLISMAQVLGMSADDVFAAYVKKNEVNFKRQETGYAVKDHDDSKHI
jgi:dimeric dUTPase (all-alpha-NTP-PPase superfamily)